ncbi:MAG: hypothetical protein A2W33_08245 [Chloroflexi bacterium RBG_16_52_11]|nr:MAG: hypothetical protein A2W33_08245 [Chloroflexi bacterium RBG_16_52_11]
MPRTAWHNPTFISAPHRKETWVRIKNMAGQNLSTLLGKSLPPAWLDLMRDISAQAATLGMPIYLVGGFVRDLLLGQSGLDFDLVVEGDAIALARSLAVRYGGKVTTHAKFKTAKLDIGKWGIVNRGSSQEARAQPLFPIDLITARSEIYKHPAALPAVKMGKITDDIQRRDFTINAMAIRLDGNHWGELLEPLGGREDLKRGLIRVLHADSFIDDPTRLVRAVRYEKRYAFSIAAETLQSIPDARLVIEKLSAERIRHELDLILDEPGAASMLERLAELDLLDPIHSALQWDQAAERRMRQETSTPSYPVPYFSIRNLRWILWLMTIPVAEIMSLNSRLQFEAGLFKSLSAARALFGDLDSFSQLKPSQYVDKLEGLPLLAVYAAFCAAPDGEIKYALDKYLAEWRHVKPKTTGHDLKKLGLEPGPKYQTILRELRDAWLNGDISTAQQEKILLEKLTE